MKLIDKEMADYERKLADANKNVDSELIRDLRKRRKNSKKSFFFSFDISFGRIVRGGNKL